MSEHVQVNLDKVMNNDKLSGKKVAIIVAGFNDHITGPMCEEAKNVLDKAGVAYEVYNVKGSFELIYALTSLLESGTFDGFVPLGCLIKGETMHFEYIAENVASGIKDLTIKYNKPIGFGVLTCQTEKQAQERICLGAEATVAVLENLVSFS